MLSGIFLVSSGAEIRPLSQWLLGDFFPNLKKKKFPNSIFFFFFFLNFHSVTTHTHKLHNDNLLIYYHCILFAFNLMAKVCVIANLFVKLTKNAVIVCLKYSQFSGLPR